MTNFSSVLRVFVASASSLFLVSAGCSSGGGTPPKEKDAAPVSLPSSPHAPAFHATSVASINNARDLAAAEPDTVLTGHASTRDLDLGGGGGAQGGKLTSESLGAALRQLDGNFENADGAWKLKVKFSEGDTQFTFPLCVEIGQDQSLIWVYTGIVQLGPDKAPPPQMLINLLVANDAMGTASYFVMNPKSTVLLQRSLPNAGVTPQLLSDNLKVFFDTLKAEASVYAPLMDLSSGGGGGSGGGNPFQ